MKQKVYITRKIPDSAAKKLKKNSMLKNGIMKTLLRR